MVDEYHQGIGFFDVAGQFAQCLAHQAGLQADVAVAHIAFDFRFRHKCGNRVDNHHVYTARTYQHIADFQCLFAGIRLGNHQFFHFHAQLARINRVEGVFGIDKGAHTAVFLALGDGFQTQGGFTGRFRAENFNNAAARQTADTERQIDAERAGRDDFEVFILMAAVHFHNGTFAELFFDLGQGCGQCFAFVFRFAAFFLVCHGGYSR